METSPFEDWSVQCDKCDIWYHLVCQNLTGQEPELQPKPPNKFFCTACKGPGKGKGCGKPSTVSVTPEQNIGNVESQDGTSTESENVVVVVIPEAIVQEVEVELQLHKVKTMMTNQLHQHQQIV